MSNEDDDEFTREELVSDKLLHTEYQEANQEFRHRNQLLHNTFYLLIISAGVFLGLFMRFGIDGDFATMGGLTIAAGVASTIIGHLFLKHFHERSSAEVVRMHTEWIANKNQMVAKRAFSLEWGVAGEGAIQDEESGRIIRRGSYIHYIDKWPDQIVSAATLGLALIYSGAVLLVAGVVLFSLSITSWKMSFAIGLATVLVILWIYRFARSQAQSPDGKHKY